MNLPKIEGFERHVVLFAKNWYDRFFDKDMSQSQKLKILFSKYSELEPEYFSDAHIYAAVADTFCKYNSPREQSEVLKRLFSPLWNKNGNMVSQETIIENMLGMISIIEIKDKYDLDGTLLDI